MIEITETIIQLHRNICQSIPTSIYTYISTQTFRTILSTTHLDIKTWNKIIKFLQTIICCNCHLERWISVLLMSQMEIGRKERLKRSLQALHHLSESTIVTFPSLNSKTQLLSLFSCPKPSPLLCLSVINRDLLVLGLYQCPSVKVQTKLWGSFWAASGDSNPVSSPTFTWAPYPDLFPNHILIWTFGPYKDCWSQQGQVIKQEHKLTHQSQ